MIRGPATYANANFAASLRKPGLTRARTSKSPTIAAVQSISPVEFVPPPPLPHQSAELHAPPEAQPSPKSRSEPPQDRQNNLENWFKSLLKCREKRKVEMKVAAAFGYIIYSVITHSVDKPGSAVDVSDGILMCDLVNALYPGSIAPVPQCRTQTDKIRNLNRYCDACVYYTSTRFE